MDIGKIIGLIGTMKKGRTTSEFVTTIIGGLLMGGVGTGLIDFTPDQMQAVTANVGDAVQTVTALKQADITMAEALIHIVGLIMGGHIVSTYIKSRGDSKAAHYLAMAKAVAAKIEELQKAGEGTQEVLTESTGKPDGPTSIPIKED